MCPEQRQDPRSGTAPFGHGTTGHTDPIKHLRDLIDKGEWKAALLEIDALQQATPKSLETRPTIASCHLLRAKALMSLGDLTKAWAESDRAIAIAKDSQQPAIEAEAQCVIANIHWKKGKLELALQVLDKAAEPAKRSGNERVIGIVALERASVHMKYQAFDLAEQEYQKAVSALERAGDQRQLVRAYNNFAHVFFYQCQWKKAEEMFLKCRNLSERAGFKSAGAWAAFNRADALLELDRTDEAKNELEWAMPIVQELGDNYGLTVTNCLLCIVQAKSGDFKNATTSLKTASELNKKIDIPHMMGRLAYTEGILHKMRGEKAKAIKSFKAAKEVYITLGSTSEVARIDAALKGLS